MAGYLTKNRRTYLEIDAYKAQLFKSFIYKYKYKSKMATHNTACLQWQIAY